MRVAKARSASVSGFSGPATDAEHPENPILEQPHPIRHLHSPAYSIGQAIGNPPSEIRPATAHQPQFLGTQPNNLDSALAIRLTTK
jgi:hypothetical protein